MPVRNQLIPAAKGQEARPFIHNGNTFFYIQLHLGTKEQFLRCCRRGGEKQYGGGWVQGLYNGVSAKVIKTRLDTYAG